MARALIIKLSSLGDLFHALPAVHAIRQGLKTDVDWITQPQYQPVVECFEDVDEVLTFPREAFLPQLPTYLRELREKKYDWIIDAQGLLKSALLVSRLARGHLRIGPSFAREGARWLYTETVGRADRHRHAVEQIFDVARYLECDSQERRFPVTFPKVAVEGPGPRVAFVPCSRWPAKNWPAANWVCVGRALRERCGARIFLVGAPSDTETCRGIEAELGEGTVNRCGETSLVELCSLMQEMDLVVAVDSGPMHVAAACGVPVLALFGVTDPRLTGPYGEGHEVLMAEELKDRPDLGRSFKDARMASRWSIDPGLVAERAVRMLKARAD